MEIIFKTPEITDELTVSEMIVILPNEQTFLFSVYVKPEEIGVIEVPLYVLIENGISILLSKLFTASFLEKIIDILSVSIDGNTYFEITAQKYEYDLRRFDFLNVKLEEKFLTKIQNNSRKGVINE